MSWMVVDMALRESAVEEAGGRLDDICHSRDNPKVIS
jgi:hypothetical protein